MLASLIFAVFLLFVRGSHGVSCPSGFETHADTCYLFSHGRETWIGAFDTCKLFGAQLVEVNDQVENSYLSNKAAALGGYWWIGLTDKQVEGEYTWETSFTNLASGNVVDWGTSEPDGKGDENCVFYAPSRNYQWADAQCDRQQHYICEIVGEETDIIG